MINPGTSCGACPACLAGEESLCSTFRVVGEHRPGTAAEYVVVPAVNLAPVPPGMPWAQAAAFSLATLTAWRMLVTRAALQPGETVLIWGIGGGVAMAALQIARLLGARVHRHQRIGRQARSRPAAGRRRDGESRDTATSSPRSGGCTDGRGADVVVDSVGQDRWTDSLRAMRRGGRLVICGATTGPMVSTRSAPALLAPVEYPGLYPGQPTVSMRRSWRSPTKGGSGRWSTRSCRSTGRRRRFARLQRGEQMGKLVIEVAHVNELWERLRSAPHQIGSVVPALVGAAVILLTGYFLARQIQRWADDTLKRLDFNRVASGRRARRGGGAHRLPARSGAGPGEADLLAGDAGRDPAREHRARPREHQQMFGTMLAFIPTLIAGIVIVILGMIVGEFVRGLILASAGSVSGVPTVAKMAKGAVVLIALFMALQQVGVAEEIVTAAFTLTLGAVALAVGLAFGLGNRELAGEITRRWYEEGRRRDRRRTDRKGPNTPPGDEPPILD